MRPYNKTPTPEQARKQVYARAWYIRNREDQQIKSRARVAAYRHKNQDHVRAYLQQHPCMDCGMDDIRVLEFDHTKDDKEYNVGDLIAKGASLDKLKLEIAKCEVVCANCHKIRTYTRRGDTYRDK